MSYRLQWLLGIALFIVFLPSIIVVFLVCAISHGFPVFYREGRLGLGRRIFTIWKFRTMRNDAAEFERIKPDLWKVHTKNPADPRITAIGRFLRRFSVDELPQLWNVVNGDMALVGPRPIVENEDFIYGRHGDLCHSVKPGMTGLWQVSGRNLTTYHRRAAIDLYYVRHRSWSMDLWILWRTVYAVVSGRGAF